MYFSWLYPEKLNIFLLLMSFSESSKLPRYLHFLQLSSPPLVTIYSSVLDSFAWRFLHQGWVVLHLLVYLFFLHHWWPMMYHLRIAGLSWGVLCWIGYNDGLQHRTVWRSIYQICIGPSITFYFFCRQAQFSQIGNRRHKLFLMRPQDRCMNGRIIEWMTN